MAGQQTAANVLVALRRETTTGVAAGATTGLASQLRITDSPGLELKRQKITSNEKREDGWKSRGRLGMKMVEGSFNAELSVGGATDLLLESIMRSAYVTSFAIGFASVTTVAISTNYLSIASGDLVGSQGVRVGDVFRITGTSVTGNHNLNTQVLAVSSLTITVATGVFATLAAAATGTLTFLKKVAVATTPTRYSYSVEQYDEDIDLSELFLGCRHIGLKLSAKPGQPVTAQYSFYGMDRTALTTNTSPYYTSPVVTTGLSLIADDATIRYNGATVSTFTGFDLDFQISAKGEAVIGSFVSPDVFDNDTTVSGSVTGLISDFSNITLFDAETEFEIFLKLEELASSPKPCIALYFPRVTIDARSAPVGGGDGAKIETLALQISPKVAATGYNAGVCTISSSGTTP